MRHWILIAALALAGCGGDVELTDALAAELPLNVETIKDAGNGWLIFSLNGNYYLMSPTGAIGSYRVSSIAASPRVSH